ncbi:MAG: PAAR domain-containing protein, partial [Acinetobacter sp.]
MLPQQNLVVQDNGGGAGSNSLLKNTQQSTQENFVEKKNFEIELVDLKVTPFIPLGVPTPEGKPSNKEHSFFIKIKKGICDAISLEVEQDGTFVEVKKIQKAFSPSQQVSLTWDGFINDFYNSKFMTKPSGVKFKVKGYSSGSVQCTHEKIFKFKY